MFSYNCCYGAAFLTTRQSKSQTSKARIKKKANSLSEPHKMGTNAEAKRIDTLSKPKPIPAGFIEERRSVYWDNNLAKDWDDVQSTKCVLSERQAQLVAVKRAHKDYVGDRPSPIWPVSEAAQNATASARVETMSSPKDLHKDYQPARPVHTTVSEAAKNAEPNQRLETLAQPKTYAPLKIKPDSEWDWSEWESDLTKAAKNATASDRVVNLSNPKVAHKDYKEGRRVIWQVPETAKKTLPSLRVQQLARPKSRSQYSEDYDSNAWRVSQGAKIAQATPRIAELAMPIPRKVRSKKVV